MRLEIGDIVKTSYGTGPYRIIHIERDCTCPEYIISLDGDESPSKPHLHLTVYLVEKGHCDKEGLSWLNGYDENTLQSVWDRDYLIPQLQPVQTTLF